MGLYASGTTVSVRKSREEIETTLERYGATSFAYGSHDGQAAVMFRAEGRMVRFVLPLPDGTEREVTHTATGIRRAASDVAQALAKEERRRWRALALAIKAKLEVVASGIATFEEEFAANVVLPDGSLVGEWLTPQIAQVYETGGMPSLLPGLPALGAGTDA